jgi:hypothetical protein
MILQNAALPPSLQELHCGRLPRIAPLLPLRYLQRLNILSCRSPSAELAQLASLTQLTHISIHYDHFDGVNPDLNDDEEDEELVPDVASAAWPVLASQLRELHIDDRRCITHPDQSPFQLSAPAVAALGSLSVLTSLTLDFLQCPDVQPQQLAAALKRCSALQQVQLGHLELQWAPDALLVNADEEVAAALLIVARARGMAAIAAAIASLPSLQQLSICSLPINMQAAVALGAAAAGAQLTQLKLDMVTPGELADCSMSAIALGLTNLRSLKLRSCNVGDAALPALARLPLQSFCWQDCNFTTAAMQLFMPHWLMR